MEIGGGGNQEANKLRSRFPELWRQQEGREGVGGGGGRWLKLRSSSYQGYSEPGERIGKEGGPVLIYCWP